jgi:nucleoid DNA-binding protein
VTKKDIVRKIAERSGLTQLEVKEVVQETFNEIVRTLLREGRIELRNFGVFEVKRRKARKARNPRTDEPVQVEAKNVVTFQPGKAMEEEVRQMTRLPERKRKPRRGKAAREERPAVNEFQNPPRERAELVGTAAGTPNDSARNGRTRRS